MRIVEIDAKDPGLQEFLAILQYAMRRGELRKIRVSLDGDVAKFKVNEHTWSPPCGHLDPMCEVAQAAMRTFPKEEK